MELEKQKLILSILCSSRDLMAITAPLMKPSYFDPSLKKSAKFVLEYFQKFRDVPKIEIVKAETGYTLDSIEGITRAEEQYVSTEIETYCRNKAVEEAILAGPALLQKGDYNGIIANLKQAITVGLSQDLGLDYFSDPEERLRKTLETQAKISTGWPDIDAMLGGGLSRQELITFLANSGGGKSMTMLNLAHNLLSQGLSGVYISLEMAEGVVTKRLDSMVSRISQNDLLKEMHKVAAAVNKVSSGYGAFRVKRMAENRTTVQHIDAYLQQLEQSTGLRPDFIIVDYIDIMGTSAAISLDNLFIKDKYVTEEIRALGLDYNAIMISASQLGRCLSTQCQIHMADGSLKLLKNIEVGDSLIGTVGDVAVVAKTEPIKKMGYKIRLKNGQEIIASRDHRFPTKSGETKSIATGLSVGDSLCTL